MSTHLDQLLIDLFVAWREKIVSEQTLHSLLLELTSTTTNTTEPGRVSDLLVSRGHLQQEQASRINLLGQSYFDALISLTSANITPSPQSPPDPYATIFESGNQDSSDTLSNDAAIRYRKLTPYAEGGLGKVWVASDQELQRKVALKEIKSARADDPACQSRFVREAQITGALEHPGIVPVYGLGRNANGRPFYAMRFVDGMNLQQAIRDLHHQNNGKPYRDQQWNRQFRKLLSRFLDVCNTIEYAHSRNVIHRDIKPSNVLLGEFGETLVVDWGLAKVLVDEAKKQDIEFSPAVTASETTQNLLVQEVDLTLLGEAVGTPAYMSPEQATGGRHAVVGKPTDIFSLGATLYHILVGKPLPVDSGNFRQVLTCELEFPFSPLTHHPDIPAPLASICIRALSFQPEDRYKTATELADDIENWLANQPVSSHRESHIEWVNRNIRLRPTLVAATALGFISIFLLTAIGLVVQNRVQASIANAREDRNQTIQRRLSEVSAGLDAAIASAKAELRNGRFEAALEFLSTAKNTTNETEFALQITAIEALEDRTLRLIDFYHYMGQAEELIFRDSSRRSSILLQRALVRVRVFERLDWWNTLPSDDLTEMQTHRLRADVYRCLFLLAAMRLKETLPAEMTAAEMLRLATSQSTRSNEAAVLLFDLLDAYRLSQGAELGRSFATKRQEMVNKILAGIAFQTPAIEWTPKNATDLYIMGTALGYWATTEETTARRSIEATLGIRDAKATSAEMLEKAAMLQSEHYWTQLVRANFEYFRDEYAESFRSFEQTISLDPDNWIGHSYFGLVLRSRAIELSPEDPLRNQLLMWAASEGERAVDLNPTSNTAHAELAHSMTWLMSDPLQPTATYRKALELQEPLDSIQDNIVESFDRQSLATIASWFGSMVESGWEKSELYACYAWAQLMLDQLDDARDNAIKSLAINPDEQIGSYVLAVVHSRQGRYADAERLFSQISSNTATSFHIAYARAMNFELLGDMESALESYNVAKLGASCRWQELAANIGIARLLIATGSELAEASVDEVIQSSDTERLDALLAVAIDSERDDIAENINAYHRLFDPILHLGSSAPPANAPLINGGMELGLTVGWGDTLEKFQRSAWQRYGGSIATAQAEQTRPHSGRKSLRIIDRGSSANGAYSELTQRVAVIEGTEYTCSFWITGRDVQRHAFGLWIDDLKIIDVPSGTFAWQHCSGRFTATSREVVIRIRCEGMGEVFLDDLAIAAR